MKESSPVKEIIDHLKPEHLSSGFEPILICIDDIDHYDNSLMGEAECVDYYNNQSEGGDSFRDNQRGYVISRISEENKYTNELYCCTSIIAVGTDKETDMNISFLTHQDPLTVNVNNNFQIDLNRRIEELKSKCKEGSVDIVLVGGNLDEDTSYSYKDTILNLSKFIEDGVGFKPVVVGPKSVRLLVADNVLFDTKNRRVYLMRNPLHDVHNDTFKAGDLDNMMKGWNR